MASKNTFAVAVMVLLLLAVPAITSVQADSCGSNPIGGLAACYPYVQGSSPPSPPGEDSSCCSEVKSADLTCLCAELKSGTPPKGLDINLSAVMAVASSCGRPITSDSCN